jgi:hypothetical protein
MFPVSVPVPVPNFLRVEYRFGFWFNGPQVSGSGSSPWLSSLSVRFLLWFSVQCSSHQRLYHVENTGSRPITEVKQHRAWSVLGWVTAWEHHVPLATESFVSHSSFVLSHREGGISAPL